MRGLTREVGHWGAFLDVFRAAFPGDVVHLPDLPGAGSALEETSPLSIAEIARRTRERVAREVPAGAKVSLFAISLGGMVAAEWIRQAPEEVDTAVLINSSGQGLAPFWQRLRPGAFLRFLFLPLLPSVSLREKIILGTTSNHAGARAAAHPLWVGIQRARGIRRATALRQMLAATRYRSLPEAIAFPVLIVASREDRLVHRACSERLRDRWHADLIYHPTAGHDVALDDPEWLARTVSDWIDLRRPGIAP